MFPITYYLTPLGWLHLALFGAVVPLLVIKNRRKMTGAGGPLPDRLRHFRTAVLEGAMLAALSARVATLQHIDLFRATLPSWRAIAAAFWPTWRPCVHAATVATRGRKRARIVHLFMPSNAAERGWWIACRSSRGSARRSRGAACRWRSWSR
jgi:hypothetical protein